MHRSTSNVSLLTATVDDDASSVRSADSEYKSEAGDFDTEHMYPFTIDDGPLYDDPLDVDDHDDDFWLEPDFDVDALPEDDVEEEADMGDTTGITVGDGGDLFVTQPALDDVGNDFFPSEEDKDLEHLCSHAFGHVHASSGLRRARNDDLIHEIDWALIRINDHRLADPLSTIPPTPGQRASTPTEYNSLDTKGVSLIPSANLANRAVHCHGRTSGFANGTILPAMRLVRMPGRVSPSHSWQVRGRFGPGGDSGAWVLDSKTGGVCGHVLAYSEASGVAYIAPMDVMMQDMQRTLGKRVALPGQAAETAMPSAVYRPEEDLPVGIKSANMIERKAVPQPISAQTTGTIKAESVGISTQQIQNMRVSRSASTATTGKVQPVFMENCQVIGDSRLQAGW